MIKHKYRAYISGPMSNVPKKNEPLFNAVSSILRGMNWAVLNPAELGHSPGWKWNDYILRDLQCMFGFRPTAIVLLPNWTKSRGSAFEVLIGLNVLKTKFFTWDAKKGLTEIHSSAVRQMIDSRLLIHNTPTKILKT